MTSEAGNNPGVETPPDIPSNVLWIEGIPDDEDDGELEMRLARVGDLVKLEREDERAVATFKNTKAAVDARSRLNGFTLSSGRTISIRFSEQVRSVTGELDAITGEVIRSNRELHWKIGQLVRSTYSAMRATNGNFPPPKQTLVPDDFRYLESASEQLDLESMWNPSMSIESMIKDYDDFIDRRPFHNRYVVVQLASRSENAVNELSSFVKALVGPQNVQEVSVFNDNEIVHFATRSTRDAAIIHSALNASLKTGEGGLIGRVDIQVVKYGPPVNTASSAGKLWLGSSAFQAVDEDRLHNMLSLFGEVEQFRLIKNKNCLFVTLKKEEDAIRCRNKLFGYEIAPGHFLNVDFAPPMPEAPEAGMKRRGESIDEPDQKRHTDGDRSIRLALSKMGEQMCHVLARKFVVQKFTGDDSQHDFFLPKEVDICNRTKVDYCKSHLEKLGCAGPLVLGGNTPSELGTIVVWQFAAASERDCQGYDALCDYFVTKERIGFFSAKDASVVTYFIPPVPAFLDPLGLPSDTRYLTAIQMPASGQVVAPSH